MKLKDVIKDFDIEEKNLTYYGNDFAKVENVAGKKNGKLILVTAMTSNKLGVGKTTVSIGLCDALNQLGNKSILSLREPSMGPVFGVKGGATGGGKASLRNSDSINLHFTGDFHAVAQANNLLSSIIDNHIFQGNELGIDKIFFKRCLDVNDRSLRDITYKIGDKTYRTGFNITAASEVMAICCLSKSLKELEKNLGEILVGTNKNGKPIFAKDLKAEKSMTVLLKDAMKPNLTLTEEGSLAAVHFGPFANIAHGASSVVATDFALSHSDYAVTEAGFGSDLGGEKFFDITSNVLKKKVAATVLVVTIGVMKEQKNFDFGLENVKKHILNLRDVFKTNLVVAINKHTKDSKSDIEKIKLLCWDLDVPCVVCEPFTKGGKGCSELAKEVLLATEKKQNTKTVYSVKEDIKTKIEKIAKTVYGAEKVTYFKQAEEKIAFAEKMGKNFYVNIAKTQFSFSDDKKLVGAPTGFEMKVKDIEIRNGANMIVAIAGNIVLMPGLAKKSNYLDIKLSSSGKIDGIF